MCVKSTRLTLKFIYRPIKFNMHRKSISALHLFFYLFGFIFLIMALFRVAFWVFAAPDMPDPLSWNAFKAFYIGLRFDARIAGLFLLPLIIALCIPKLAEKLHKAAKPVTAVYTLLLFGLICIYSADFGFYAYLKSRVSSLLFELLQDFGEAVNMVRQSYPVPLITLGVVGATAICGFIFYKLVSIPVRVSPRRSRRAIGFIGGLLFFALAVYGQINSSFFPLRWSNAFFTTQEAIIALGLNPVQSIYDTYGADSAGFCPYAAKEAYPAMAEFLLVDKPDAQTLNYLRSFKGKSRGEATPPNVIIIIMESLAYPKTSFAPGQGNPTPRLKELAGESLVFHRYFANARTTARGVFSVMTGVPDVNLSSTSSRNPLVVDQRVIGNEFKGYDKYYLIGGNTSWANIRSILGQNIEGLRILEEDYWKAPRADVWGVDDYDMFKEANELFAARDPKRPFLAVIQTASFHKPYTVPETPGFEIIPLSEEDRHNYGFESQEEYNSMRYTDFAVGEFIRWAKEKGYYHNTIFFILGDHGLNDKVHNMFGGYIAARLAPWHVPLLIHAPAELGLVAPGETMMPASHVDVFPTAAGLAGIPYRNWTLGRDLFDARYDASREVYIGGKATEPIHLVKGDYCYLDNRAGEHRLYRISDAEAVDLADREPALFLQMQKLAEDMDATIRYMLFNNRKSGR